MKKYTLILALVLTNIFANAQSRILIQSTGTCYDFVTQAIVTYPTTTTAAVYYASNEDFSSPVNVFPSGVTTFGVTSLVGTYVICTLTPSQYLQTSGVLGGCPPFSLVNRVKAYTNVKLPTGFKGQLNSLGEIYIGVNDYSKASAVKTSVGSFEGIVITVPPYSPSSYTSSYTANATSVISYSVNLPTSYTGIATFTVSPKYDGFQKKVDNTFITTNVIATLSITSPGTYTATQVIKSYDQTSTTTYTCRYIVAATPPVTLSNNCTLTNLTTSVGTLTPTFATTQTTYTITLPYLTTLPTTLTTANFSYSLPTGATISSSTTAILTATNSVSTLTFVVRAEDNVTTKTYRIIYKLASPDNNANLASLSSSQGTLSPAFSPNTQIYTVTLPFGVAMDNSLLVATTQSSFATITTNTISGNSKVVAVKAQAGNTKSYRVDYSNAPDPTLSVHENSFNEVVVYPNPTKDKLFIKSEKAIKNVVVYNVDGKVVVKQNTQEVDIKHLPAGVYYIEINQNKNRTKIIKE